MSGWPALIDWVAASVSSQGGCAQLSLLFRLSRVASSFFSPSICAYLTGKENYFSGIFDISSLLTAMDLAANCSSSLDMVNASGPDQESFNLTVFLMEGLGPQRQSLNVVLPITCIYPILFVLGVGGNLLTCVVIYKNSYMHTTTNYYLFSLAVSDVLMLLLGECMSMVYCLSRHQVFGLRQMTGLFFHWQVQAIGHTSGPKEKIQFLNLDLFLKLPASFPS
jgi:7 transmembrane receptor (rhodopsin family)